MPPSKEIQLFFYIDGQISTIIGLQNVSLFRTSDLSLTEIQHKSNNTTFLAVDRSNSNKIEYRSNLANTISYTPYGDLGKNAPTTYLSHFNGERRTEHGSYLLSYRWYLPSLMRFSSPDRLSPFSEETRNSYAYCNNDPINFKDPSGNTRKSVHWPKLNVVRPPVQQKSTEANALVSILKNSQHLPLDSNNAQANAYDISKYKTQKQLQDRERQLRESLDDYKSFPEELRSEEITQAFVRSKNEHRAIKTALHAEIKALRNEEQDNDVWDQTRPRFRYHPPSA